MMETISGVTGGGQGAECPPETSDGKIFAALPGKNRQGKMEKGEIEKKRRKIITRSGNRSGHSRMIFAGGSDPKLTLTPWME